MNVRQVNAQITKEKIYKAALALFEEKGYVNTSISDITKRAGVAKGSFYTHFNSKEHLVAHTAEVYDKITYDSYNEACKIENFEERVYKYCELLYAGVVDMGKEIIRALYRNNIVDPSVQIVNNPNRGIYTALKNLMQYGIDKKMLSPQKPVDFYINRFVILFMGLDYYWCCSTNYINMVDISQRQVRVTLKGMMDE